MEISIVLPCRNEEKAIGHIVKKAKDVLLDNGIEGEVIVSDSSKDKSAEIALSQGARVIKHGKKGYGIAYIEGINAAKGKYIFCADSDGTYDINQLPKFLTYLRQGYEFVIGNRFLGKMQKGAMPWHHKHIGNPILSGVLRLFFHSNIRDSHCGMRAFTKDAWKQMKLKTTGMEFASEMVIRASNSKLKIKQIPINYYRRIGKSKLSSFSDGWRHLRFMLMYAPNYLFMVPGIILMILGLTILIVLISGPVTINKISFYTHPSIFGAFLTIVGYQIITLGIYSKTYAVGTGFSKKDKLVSFIAKYINFESGIIFGGAICLISLLLGLNILLGWIIKGFPNLNKTNETLLILTLGIIGVQTIFSAFFLSILLIQRGENK